MDSLVVLDMAHPNTIQVLVAVLAVLQLVEHLTKAHAFIENTAAFGHGASFGILDCGGCIWNIDESKAALAAAREAGLGPLLIPKNLR